VEADHGPLAADGEAPQDVLLDLARERCPTCNSDVRPEIVELMDVGHDYNNERRDD
jgi:hypothetical protein